MEKKSVLALIKTVIFGSEKPKSYKKRHQGTYYKDVYFSENAFKALQFLAKYEKESIKAMADKLIVLGYSSYAGELVKKYIGVVFANEERARQGNDLLPLPIDLKKLRKILIEERIPDRFHRNCNQV